MDAALLRELARWWADINQSQFEGAMRPPCLCLDDTSRRLGCWKREERTLSLAARLVVEHPWTVVLEVLRHEMAHQYVDEVLGVRDETAHGPTFQAVCEARAIDGRAAGALEVDETHAAVMRRVSRLLALADSDNEHEAASAMNAAHRLMRKHNVSLTAGSSDSGRYRFVQLGEVRGRTPAHEKILAGILGQHFFVQPIWVVAYMPKSGRRGRVLEVCGRPENLQMAVHAHDFLLETCERLWARHKRERGIRGDKDRRRFYSGVMIGFNERLSAVAAQAEETGLVWVGDADLDAWTARRHPHLRQSRRTRMNVDGAWHAGRAQGQKIVLRRPISKKGRGIRGLLGAQ